MPHLQALALAVPLGLLLFAVGRALSARVGEAIGLNFLLKDSFRE